MNSLKKSWNRFTAFCKEDSWQSWVVCLVLLFIGIKFLFFPLLSLIFGTSQTLVVIETGSLHHEGTFGNIFYLPANFESWWQEGNSWYLKNNITKEQASTWPFKTGMEIGDIIVLSSRGKINIGDIIVFEAGQKRPVIHRVVKITEINGKKIYSTKGDNPFTNTEQLSFEKSIPEDKIIGKAVAKFPRLGYPKVIFAKILGI